MKPTIYPIDDHYTDDAAIDFAATIRDVVRPEYDRDVQDGETRSFDEWLADYVAIILHERTQEAYDEATEEAVDMMQAMPVIDVFDPVDDYDLPW